jgi:hypothetical protein
VRIRFLLVGGSRPPDDADGYSERDVSSPETERFGTAEGTSPWYLKRWVLALWGLTVVILIATIIYGLAILAKGGGGGTPATTTTRPSTSAPSRTNTSSLTPSSTLPSTTAPSTSTETTEPDLPTTPPWTTQQHQHHHRWLSNLPPIPPIPHF